MSFEVSIIIPSYNRYPLNLYTLYALEQQHYDLTKMEVILVDDASTDNTPHLQYFRPPFAFRYVRNKHNIGVCGARNKGLQMAKGRILILLDAETLVGPDYVKHHVRHHQKDEMTVVVGRNRSRLFTHLYPGFNQDQVKLLRELAKKHPAVQKRIEERLQQHCGDSRLQHYLRHGKKIVPLLDKEELSDRSVLAPFSIQTGKHNRLTRYVSKRTHSHLTWRLCLGSNHSFTKTLFDKAGGYDENFKGWGAEDNEFAYRLYRAGGRYILDHDLYRYHQVHPNFHKKRVNRSSNKDLFLKKHPTIDIFIPYLAKIKEYDFAFVDHVLEEQHTLSQKFPHQFTSFKRSIVRMLQQIKKLHDQNEPIRNLLKRSGITDNRKKQIISERKTIQAMGKYNHLVRLFNLLAKR